MNDTNTFGAFLRSMRKQLDITQEIAAKKAGISGSYLAQLESGKRSPPSADIVRRIAHAYAVDVAVMLNEAGYGESPKTQISLERVEWAFNAMCADPAFCYGHAIRNKPFDMDTKLFLIAVYSHCTGRVLLTETLTETERLQTAEGVRPLEARLTATMKHIEPQVRHLIREWNPENPAVESEDGGSIANKSSSNAAQVAPLEEPEKLPVRRMIMKSKEAPQTVTTADSSDKPSTFRKIRKLKGGS